MKPCGRDALPAKVTVACFQAEWLPERSRARARTTCCPEVKADREPTGRSYGGLASSGNGVPSSSNSTAATAWLSWAFALIVRALKPGLESDGAVRVIVGGWVSFPPPSRTDTVTAVEVVEAPSLSVARAVSNWVPASSGCQARSNGDASSVPMSVVPS